MDVHLSWLRAVGVVSVVGEIAWCGTSVVTHRQWLKTVMEDIITVCRYARRDGPMIRKQAHTRAEHPPAMVHPTRCASHGDGGSKKGADQQFGHCLMDTIFLGIKTRVLYRPEMRNEGKRRRGRVCGLLGRSCTGPAFGIKRTAASHIM